MRLRTSEWTVVRFWLPVCLLGALSSNAAPGQAAERPKDADRVVPISAALCNEMKVHRVMNPGAPVACDRLRLVTFGYLGFDGQIHDDGEIVVLDAASDHVLQIFVALRARRFPLASARLMNEYEGNDDASMDRNNTSSHNVRPVAGSNSISLHAFGLAIDLNPVQNPFLQRKGGKLTISPKAGADYVDRKNARAGMSEQVVDLFADHGFVIWGGEWKNPTDYQHFQVSRKFADQLTRAPAADAKSRFERHVARYRACVRDAPDKGASTRRSCAKDGG